MKKRNPYYVVLLGIAGLLFLCATAYVILWPAVMFVLTGDWSILLLYVVLFGIGFLAYKGQMWGQR